MVGQEDICAMLKGIQYGNCDISEWNGSYLDDMQNKETVSGNKAKEIAISILNNEV